MRRILPLACLLALPAIAGVPMVRNPAAPPAARKFVFKEELRFGGGIGGDPYVWALPSTNLDVDRNGRFYIADRRENRILVFDAQGRFLQRLAKQGEGPGELLGLFNYTVLADGRGVAFDLKSGRLGRLIYFDSERRFSHITEQPFGGDQHKVLRTLAVSPDNRYMAGQYFYYDPANPGGDLGKSGLFTTDFKLVRDYSSVTLPRLDFSKVEDTNYWVEFLAGHFVGMFKSNGVFAFGRQGQFYSALTNNYVITRAELASPPRDRLSFGREYKPILRTDAQVDGWVDLVLGVTSSNFLMGAVNDRVVRKAYTAANLSPAQPPIFALVPLEDDRVLVVHDVNLEDGTNRADLFDGKGRFIAQGHLPNHAMVGFASRFFPRLVFRNGKAYGIETDEEGEVWAVRWRYALEPAR